MGTYLDVVCDIPFHHDHLQNGENHHQVTWVFFTRHEIHNTDEGNITHIEQSYGLLERDLDNKGFEHAQHTRTV